MKNFITSEEYTALLEKRESLENLYDTLKRGFDIQISSNQNWNAHYFILFSKIDYDIMRFYNEQGNEIGSICFDGRMKLPKKIESIIDPEIGKEIKLKDMDKLKNFSCNLDRYNFFLEACHCVYKLSGAKVSDFIRQALKGRTLRQTTSIRYLNEQIDYYQNKIIETVPEIYDYKDTYAVLDKYR